jgi:hypothetical protein
MDSVDTHTPWIVLTTFRFRPPLSGIDTLGRSLSHAYPFFTVSDSSLAVTSYLTLFSWKYGLANCKSRHKNLLGRTIRRVLCHPER